MGVSSSSWSAGLPPTSCVTGWDFRSGHAGTGKGLEVVGDVHPIFSCNSFATDFRSSVVSSWNDQGGYYDAVLADEASAEIAFLINL